jgi:hypothetical protein
MRVERVGYFADFTRPPFPVFESSGTNLFRASMYRSEPRERVGSKIIALMLLLLI